MAAPVDCDSNGGDTDGKPTGLSLHTIGDILWPDCTYRCLCHHRQPQLAVRLNDRVVADEQVATPTVRITLSPRLIVPAVRPFDRSCSRPNCGPQMRLTVRLETPTRYTSIVGCPAVGDTTTTTIESGCHRPPIGTINPPDLSEHVCWVRWQRSGPFHVDGRQRWRPGYRGLVAVARHGFNGWRQRLLQPRQPPTRIVVRP